MTSNNRFVCSFALIVLTSALLASCGPPMKNADLEKAQASFAAAKMDPVVVQNAPLGLQTAETSLETAESLWRADAKPAEVSHHAYLALQRTAIAKETANQKVAEARVESASSDRDKVLLEARTSEANQATMAAELSRRQAQEANKTAELSRWQAREANKAAELSLQQTQEANKAAELSRQQTQEANKAAELSRQQAQEQSTLLAAKTVEGQQSAAAARTAESRAKQLEAEVAQLQAIKSERGLVITLGDVLFDTEKAQLKGGAMVTISKIANFMKTYPTRTLLVEGFTDSRGSEAYNFDLSERRANAISSGLTASGVEAERIEVRGYGESYSVASNETAVGRQLNRRVEVIISDEEGRIAERR